MCVYQSVYACTCTYICIHTNICVFVHTDFFFFFSCARASLLCGGFLQLWQVGASLRCGVWASHCGGFSCEALALGCVGFSSCRSWILECTGFSSCGTQLLHGMGNLTEPGIEPVSPALVGRFLTTGPPGKSLILHFKVLNSPVSFHYGLIQTYMST